MKKLLQDDAEAEDGKEHGTEDVSRKNDGKKVEKYDQMEKNLRGNGEKVYYRNK